MLSAYGGPAILTDRMPRAPGFAPGRVASRAEPEWPGGEEEPRVTADELAVFRERLQAERDRIMKELGYMETRFLRSTPREASGDLSGYVFHLADVGTDADEREKAVQLTSAEGRLLAAVNAALDRIEAGTYGTCLRCGGEIGVKRLEAMPSATQCIACQEAQERNSR